MHHDYGSRRGLLSVILVFVFLAGSSTMLGQTKNPDADEIFRSMSNFLGSAKAFNVMVDVSNEIITKEGEKLQFNSHGALLFQRPSHFYLTRQGPIADLETYFDGKTVTIYGKTFNAYFQQPIAGTADDAFALIEGTLGIALPGTDLLVADPYAALSEDVTSSGYHGIDYIQGVACHHLSFRSDKVDWQLWVKDGKEPMPMKYVITSKWMTGAPQFTVQLSDWNLKPTIAANQFTFVPPAGSYKLETLKVNEVGEIEEPKEVKQ